MRCYNIWAVVAALGIGISPYSVAAKTEPLRLKHSSQWVANYADNSCRLMRQFGTGDDIVVAVFNRYGPGDDFQFTLAGKPVRKFFGRTETQLQFGPNEAVQDHGYDEGTIGDLPALIFGNVGIDYFEFVKIKTLDNTDQWVQRPPTPPEKLAAISFLVVGRTEGPKIILETGSLKKPFEALNACVDNLVTTWGVDPVKDKQLQRRATPIGNPLAWITTNDYPMAMVRAGQPAMVQVRLDVGADGQLTGCHIQETTRPKEFDAAVCNSLTRRARFTPALDDKGQPIASYWRRTIKFKIPR